MIESKRQFAMALLGLACAAGMVGCSNQTLAVASPTAKLPAGEGSPEYLDRISSQSKVSQDDAMRGMLLLLSGEDDSETFETRVKTLMEKRIVPASWSFAGDKPITRGQLAYMVFQASGMPGGLVLTVFGPSQRYCLRELQYRGFVSAGEMFSEVSGMEFVAVLTRLDTYLETGKVPDILATSE